MLLTLFLLVLIIISQSKKKAKFRFALRLKQLARRIYVEPDPREDHFFSVSEFERHYFAHLKERQEPKKYRTRFK